MKQRRKAEYVKIGGVLHKLCTGPRHPEGKWVPVKNYYHKTTGKYKGKPRSQCKDCELARAQRSVQMVPRNRMMPFLEELVRRVGKAEAARRIGVTQQAIWRWYVQRDTRWMRRKYATALLLAVREARENDEVRHRDSIRHGAYLRGRTEKRPTHWNDYYSKADDTENERKRAKRRLTSAV